MKNQFNEPDQRQQEVESVLSEGREYTRMFGRWNNWEQAAEYNLQVYYEICDYLGEDKIIILGWKWGKPHTWDNLVYYELKDWNNFCVMGVPGAGKDGLQGLILDQYHQLFDYPVLLHDRANEYWFHKLANQKFVSLQVLHELGMEALAVRDLETVSPLTAGLQTDQQFGISWKDILSLSSPYDWFLFKQFLTFDAESVSPSVYREIQELHSYKSYTYKGMFDALALIHSRLMEEKKGGQIARSLDENINSLRVRNAVVENPTYDLAAALQAHKYVDFVTSLSAEDTILNLYETFVSAQVFDWSNKRTIPNIVDAFSEVTMVYRRNQAKTPLSELLDRKVARERKQGNDIIFSSQYINEFPEPLLAGSTCLLTVKPQTDSQKDLILAKNNTAKTVELLDSMPDMPAQPYHSVQEFPGWLFIAKGFEPQVMQPFSSNSQQHHVSRRV